MWQVHFYEDNDMRIERVDEKTVKCFLSNEELEEYEIDYKDFVLRSDKAREVVQEIIEQAAEEVGYKPPKFAFDLQIMMLPDQGLILTFSDRDPEIKESDQFIECLKEMKRILQRTREKISGEGTVQSAESGPGPNAGEAEGKQTEGKQAQQVSRPSFAVFAFSELGRIIEFAAMLPSNLQVESSLYQMDGLYFLYLLKGRASYERYSRACIQALEFASLYAAEPSQTVQLEEHGECLIAEKALKKLRK
jgi:adapter protein MecA 1/2